MLNLWWFANTSHVQSHNSTLSVNSCFSVAGKRDEGEGSAGGSGGHAGVRLLSALLTEMDGMELATGTTPPKM